VTVVAIPSQKALLMCLYVFPGKFSVLAPRCSRALLHNLHLTSDRCLIFASHLATRMIPAIAIISRLLCLQGTRGSFKYFPKKSLSNRLQCEIGGRVNMVVAHIRADGLSLETDSWGRARGESKGFRQQPKIILDLPFGFPINNNLSAAQGYVTT